MTSQNLVDSSVQYGWSDTFENCVEIKFQEKYDILKYAVAKVKSHDQNHWHKFVF